MATITSYGSITIVDITDIGEFSVYPKCTLPTTVIYSPDDGNYTPDWASQNLVITPVAYYAGSPVSTGITWTWTRQEGNGTATAISSSNGESVSNGVLTVNKNQFNGSYAQLTYIITATYSDASLGKDLVAEGQITFSKVQQGTSAKTARITGENIFKYATDGSISSPIDSNQKSYITLNSSVTQCTVTGWKYKKADGTFAAYPAKSNASPATYPSGTTGAVLNVYPDDATFFGDRATIRLETSDNNTFDEFTIYKLRDGAAGTSALTAVLTNEDQMIPANSSGAPVNIAQSGATSQIKILRGGVDVTASENWSISTSSDSGISFTPSTTAQTNDTVTVTGMNNDLAAGNIYFTAQRVSGSTTETLNKTFSLVKVKAGADAETFTIYSLNVDTLALNRNGTTFTPSSFIASAFKTEVSTTGATTSAFSGKWKITESYNNGNADVVKVATTADAASTKTYTPSGETVSKIKVQLYDSAGTNKLDTQTVVVTTDGKQGEQGPQGNAGADAISILLGNEAQVFPCTNNNYPVNEITVEIPFGAYKGTARVAATINTRPALLSINPTTYTAATTATDGKLIYKIPTTKQINSTNGTLALVITCEGQTFNKTFSWTRSSAAKDGVDGTTILLYTPSGTVFENGTGTLTVEGYLQSGSTDVTSSATWAWYQWNGSSYAALTTTTTNNAYYSGKTLTVKAAAVDGYASFKVEATYPTTNGKTYTQYISLIDKTDPIQVSVHSTLGTQLVNGQGSGALYARVTRNGEEIDPIGDTAISAGTANPSGGNNGDHYIKLDEANKTATLYYKDGGSWKVQPLTATYEWSFRNAQNQPITDSTTLTNKFKNAYNSTTGKVTGKCLYLDKVTVDNKITADVKVTV